MLSLSWSPLHVLFGGCCRSWSWSLLGALCKHLFRTPVLVPAQSAMARMRYVACFCDGFACIDAVALASFAWADGFLYAALFYLCCVFAVCSLCVCFVCLYDCLLVCLFACLLVCLNVCLFVCLIVCLFVC